MELIAMGIARAVDMPSGSFARRWLAYRLAVVALAMLPAPALAQEPRLDASRLTCAALQRALAEAGAATVEWRSRFSGSMVWDRFVSRVDLCYGVDAALRRAEVVAADTASCPITRCGGRPSGGGR